MPFLLYFIIFLFTCSLSISISAKEVLIADIPQDWHLLKEQNTPQVKLTEYSAIDSIFRIITFHHLPKEAPHDFFNRLFQAESSVCDYHASENIFEGMEQGYPVSVQMDWCGELNSAGEDMITVRLSKVMIEDHHWVIQIEKKVAMQSVEVAVDEKKLIHWMSIIKGVHLSTTQ